MLTHTKATLNTEVASNQRIAETTKIVSGIKKRRYAFIDDATSNETAKEINIANERKSTTGKDPEGRLGRQTLGGQQKEDAMHCD